MVQIQCIVVSSSSADMLFFLLVLNCGAFWFGVGDVVPFSMYLRMFRRLSSRCIVILALFKVWL